MHSMLIFLFLTLLTITTTPTLATPSPVVGRYVVLAGDTTLVCLNVGELEVYDTALVNVARHSTVWQSDYWDVATFPPSNLVDGDVNTIAHTSCRPGAQAGIPVFGNLTLPNTTTPVANASYAWIAMDLGFDILISSVMVQNRRDPCCTFRLGEGVHLLILNSTGVSTFASPTLTTNLTQTLIATPTNTPTDVPTDIPTYQPTTAPYYPTQAPTPSFPWYPTYPPTTTPTPSFTPDRGNFWPWSTPSGTLPFAKAASSLNPPSDSLHHIVWQLDVVRNTSIAPAGWESLPNGLFSDGWLTSQHAYYHVTFYNYNDAINFWDIYMIPGSARAWIQYGNTVRQENTLTVGATTLMLRYSYLWNENRIPQLSASTSTDWTYYVYYVTARSRDGEFRMLTYPTYSQAQLAYSAAVIETAMPSRENQWTTVKLYSSGYVNDQFTTCRGSELEHLGAFQWLELPRSYSRFSSSYTYYMLVSWRSLSGVRLERMQAYLDPQSASAAQSWVTWYSNTYDPSFARVTSAVYYNQNVYYYGNYDYSYMQPLIQHYYWLTGTSTPSPSTPYPYITPTPSDPNTSTRWADLTANQQQFIIAYPTALIVAAVIILLITGCCLKRGASPLSTSKSPADISPCYRRLSCVVILLCLASLALLIISISVKNFNTVSVKYSSTYWAKYGPFHVFQTTFDWAWLPVYWNAQVMGIVAGVAMIISMVASTATIGIIKNSWGTTSRTLFLSILALISSLLAAVVWIPVHVRVFDRNIEYAVLRGTSSGANPYPNGRWDPYYYRNISSYSVQQVVGTSYILLCVTVILQLVNVIIVTGIHKKCCTRSIATPQQAHNDNDGLQLVQPTSPYYYRDVPAVPAAVAVAAPVSVPAVPAPYIYGVPASPAPPSFAFTHYQPQPSGTGYTAPMYYPPPAAAAPVAEPLHQPIVAPAPYPAQAAVPLAVAVAVPVAVPVPAPGPASAGYPTLPVDVPASGPSTSYQRLL